MTDAEKVKAYERILHKVQWYAAVNINYVKMEDLIELICNWSYAHRSGNGELTEEEQQARIDEAFKKLEAFK